jgi:hypothetical protein
MRSSLVIVAMVASVLVVSGCAGQSAAAREPRPSPPAPPDLNTPEAAVRSYLEWTTYAYRMANSDLATRTMSPAEEVRVDSYVENNKEQGQILDQRLTSIAFGKSTLQGKARVIVPAHEVWEYRYLSLLEVPASPLYTASYDTTYTLVSQVPGRWVVDGVEAKALGEIK